MSTQSLAQSSGIHLDHKQRYQTEVSHLQPEQFASSPVLTPHYLASSLPSQTQQLCQLRTSKRGRRGQVVHTSRHCRLAGEQVCTERAAGAGQDWGCLGACAQQRRVRHGGGSLLGAGASRLLACTLCLSSLSSWPSEPGSFSMEQASGECSAGGGEGWPTRGAFQAFFTSSGSQAVGRRERRSCPALKGKGFLWKERIKVSGVPSSSRGQSWIGEEWKGYIT